MKKGIIIGILIAVSIILFKPQNVKAAYADGWIRNYDQLSRVNLYEINSSSLTALDVYVEQVYLQDADEDYNVSQYRDMFYYDNFDGFTVGQRGFIYEFGIDKTLNKNYLYSYSVAFCTNQDSFGTNYDIETYGGWYGTSWSEGANTNTDTLQYNSLNSLSTKPFGGTGTNNFKSCYQMNGYIVPDHNIAFMHLHFNKKSGTKSGVMVYMLGAKIEAQGIYTEAIEDIFSNVVENGGLATGEQMEQVQDKIDKVDESINGDYDYNDKPSEELEGKEELDNLKEKEDELLGNLDFSGAEDIEVVINPNTSSFIWEMVERLRNMNGKIILFITSILSLGIIKMILNR